MPSQRRMAYAAFGTPRIRWWEDEFDKLSAEIRQKGLHLHGRAAANRVIAARVFGLICVA